jgi:hypothetical protein
LLTDFQPHSEGDLEAVILAESFDLLGRIVGPYMYSVSGEGDGQVAIFRVEEIHALFYIRVHEFLVDATKVSPGTSLPPTLSLLTGGRWVADRHRALADGAGMRQSYADAIEWFARKHRIVFWAPGIGRHLRLELPMSGLISMRANLEKHHLLRLTKELRRLHQRCTQAGCDLTLTQAVSVRPEFESHIKGMLEYHATEVAEHVGRCLLGLRRFVREIYEENPTNNLDIARFLPDVSDEVFRYMYTSTVFQLAQWTDQRILSSTPTTAATFKKPYRQHAEWSIVERERLSSRGDR